MINLTQLLFPETASGRTGRSSDGSALGDSLRPGSRPRLFVDWKADGILHPHEARAVVDDLAKLDVAMLMVSDCDPEEGLGFLDIVRYATSRGLPVTVSIKEKLVSATVAQWVKAAGVEYVCAGINGPESIHDYVTGIDGAYATLMQTIRNCRAAGLRVELVFHLGKRTWQYLSHVFEVVERERLQRLLVAHQVYTHRGGHLLDPSAEESRQIMDYLMEKATEYRVQDGDFELRTTDNFADALYAYLKTRQWDPDRAERMWQRLTESEGNLAGVQVAAIDSSGYVLPDPHTPYYTFGNVREQPFSEIWNEPRHPMLQGLRTRTLLLNGRCGICQWLAVCCGNSRTRAEATTGDFWGADPQCYLTEAEITPPPQVLDQG